MNSVMDQQYRTANSKTTVCGRPLHPREPTVRVERLEAEVRRYGRIVPTSNGSYHILHTSTAESLSEGSAHPFSEESKVVRPHCSVVDMNVAVNRVGRKANRVTGATDSASGVYDTTNDSNITEDNCDCAVVDGADVSSQINKAIPRSYSTDNHFKKSALAYGEWERDLTIYAGNRSSNSNGSNKGLKHVSTDRQYVLKDTQERWEIIIDPDSEPDSIKSWMPSKKEMVDLVSTKHVNLHCDRSGNSAGQSRHCNVADTRKDPEECAKQRRHSAPDNPLGESKEEETKQKMDRRWSFNMESDMLQTDHRETVKKHYLNRLLLSKDANLDSWNVFIDITHDELTNEELQFPEPKTTVVKEEKEEAVSAVPEQNSSGVEHSLRVSSPCNKETVCEESPCSEFEKELNTEGEDTIETSTVFISVPINQLYSSINVLEESPVSDREDRSSVEVILPDDKSNLYDVKATDPLAYDPHINALCVKCEKGECVQHLSCNSAEGLKTHGCYNRDACYQNINILSKNTKDSIQVSANVKTDVCRNSEPGCRIRISSQECSSGMTTNDASKNAKYGNRTADSFLAKTEEVSDACSTYANTEKSVPVNSTNCNRSSEEWSHLVRQVNCSNTEADKKKLSRSFNDSANDVSKMVCEYFELNNGNRSSSPPETRKRVKGEPRLITSRRPELDCNKEESDNHSKIRVKQQGLRKQRSSLRSFRHDNIHVFEVSTAFPPQNTHVPWRSKCNKPEFLDPFHPKTVNPPSPAQSRLDTSTDGEYDTPSPGRLTIDLGDQNTTESYLSNVLEEHSKRKRNRPKKRKAGDASANVNVTQDKLTAQMQEKGRRLAQELPGFNWLEEKILNGGLSTVLPPKRVSGASVVDPVNKSILVSERANGVSDAANSSGLPTASSPPVQRNSTRLQEYLLGPPKRARFLSTKSSEAGKHSKPPSATLPLAPVAGVKPLHCPQKRTPRHVQPPLTASDREDSLHSQSSGRSGVVSGSELAKASDVSPLLRHLTSGGELEVTLSTPSTSSVVAHSGVVSLSSHKTSSDGGQPDRTHVSVKHVNAGNRQQYADERPRDAPQHPSVSHKRINYAVEQLSQPHQPTRRIFRPYEHTPVCVRNTEPPRWQGDLPARRVQENSSSSSSGSGSGSADAAYSDRIATMARHAATSFDTGFGMGPAVPQEACHRFARHQQHRPPDSAQQPTTCHREHALRPSGFLHPHVQRPGASDFRSSQYKLWQPLCVVSQQSVAPQIVRPSAQYPVGMGSCHHSYACWPTCTAASNSQAFFPGIPRHGDSQIASDPSVFSPYASRRKTAPSMSSTSSALLSTHSNSVQETASEAPQTVSSTHNQAQIPGPQNEAHTSDPENQAVISDPVGFHNPGKAVEPRTAVPAATAASSESSKTILHVAFPTTAQERHQPLVQDTQKSAQRPYNTAGANESSMTDLHTILPVITQEFNQSAAACGNHQLGVGCKHPQSNITQNNLQSGGACWNKQSAFTHENHPSKVACENHQFGAACRNQQSCDACQSQGSEVASDNHPSEAACKNQQSAAAGENSQSGAAYKSQQSEVGHENHQSGAACKNEELPIACENNQLKNEVKSEDSAVAHDHCHSGVTCKNFVTHQKCSVTSDSTVTSIQGLSATFPAVVQANQQLESTHDSHKIQQKQNISSDSTGSSVPVLNKTLKTEMWEKESSGVANENSQTQQVPSCSSGSTDSSIPKLHTKITIDKSENNLTQQKLTVSSNSTGNSLTQLNLTFPALAHENHQSDIVSKNHEKQQKLNVTSDNTRSSVSALNVTLPAAVPVNKQSGVGCDNEQSENACRNHTTRHEPSATADNRLTGSSVPGLNVTFSGLAQENQQSGFPCRNQRQRDACGQHQSAVPFENCQSVQRTSGTVDVSRSPIPGLHMVYPTVTCEKYQSERQHNVSVHSMTRNSAPELLTTHPTTGYQNQEAVPRPLPPSPLLFQPPLPIPVSHQITHSQRQPAPHLQTQPVVLHPHPVKSAHPPLSPSHSKFVLVAWPSVHPQLPYMPWPLLYPQLPVSQAALKSQLSSVSQTSHFQSSPISRESPHSQSVVTSGTSPHCHTLSKTQTAPHYESSSGESPSVVSDVTQFRSVQQSSLITQEPHVMKPSTSNGLQSSTVEEYPIDLSIGKQKSAVETTVPPLCQRTDTSIIPPLCQRKEQNNPGQHSTSPRHHQGRSEVQASVVQNLRPEGHNYSMRHSHMTQLQSAQTSGHKQQPQTSKQTDTTGMYPLLASLVFTPDNSAGEGGVEKGCYRLQTSVAEHANRQKQSGTMAGEHSHTHSQLLVCGYCKQTAKFRCSSCRNEWYCSIECQKRHWDYHSIDCRRQLQNRDQ